VGIRRFGRFDLFFDRSGHIFHIMLDGGEPRHESIAIVCQAVHSLRELSRCRFRVEGVRCGLA
jgi:hypothetical protein